jgi:hypothetical protein
METDIRLLLSCCCQFMLDSSDFGDSDEGLGIVRISCTNLVDCVSKSTADGLIVDGSARRLERLVKVLSLGLSCLHANVCECEWSDGCRAARIRHSHCEADILRECGLQGRVKGA